MKDSSLLPPALVGQGWLVRYWGRGGGWCTGKKAVTKEHPRATEPTSQGLPSQPRGSFSNVTGGWDEEFVGPV